MLTGRRKVAFGRGPREAAAWIMRDGLRDSARAALIAGAACLSACAAPVPSTPPAPEPPRPTFGELATRCLALVDQGLTGIRRAADATTTDWRVQLQNPCPQAIPALVELWVLDRNNVAIGYEARRVTAPANAAFDASGQIVVPRAQAQAIASTITRWGADPSQAALPAPVAVQVAATNPMPVAAPSAPPTAAPLAAPAAPARPAPLAAPPAAATPLAAPAATSGGGAPGVDMTVLGVTWQGNAAVAQVEFVNGTGAPAQGSNLTCDFIALGQVLGRGAQRVPALRPGEHTTIAVVAEVGGQLVDQVLCAGT